MNAWASWDAQNGRQANGIMVEGDRFITLRAFHDTVAAVPLEYRQGVADELRQSCKIVHELYVAEIGWQGIEIRMVDGAGHSAATFGLNLFDPVRIDWTCEKGDRHANHAA